MIVEFRNIGMNIGWEHFVSQYDAARFVSSDGRDTRHIQFVREFAVMSGGVHPQGLDDSKGGQAALERGLT